MYQAPLPEGYAALSDAETDARITAARGALGDRLVILGHHYQRDEIIAHADFRGDSYKLAKDASARPDAEFIVFCGVHFMAESADILTPPEQQVILPNLAAGCSMADMANLFQVRSAWKQIHEALGPTADVVPVTYINSAANLKGFVGEHGGTVCTSTNAPAAVAWALGEGRAAHLLPRPAPRAQHGREARLRPGARHGRVGPLQAARREHRRGPAAGEVLPVEGALLGPRALHDAADRGGAARPAGGAGHRASRNARLDVVEAADEAGSTEYILKQITAAPSGSKWAVGTEINLVSRLAKEMPDKTVVCLDPMICPCSTMYRIHPSFLLWTLEELAQGRVMNRIVVPDKVKDAALVALQQMLLLK